MQEELTPSECDHGEVRLTHAVGRGGERLAQPVRSSHPADAHRGRLSWATCASVLRRVTQRCVWHCITAGNLRTPIPTLYQRSRGWWTVSVGRRRGWAPNPCVGTAHGPLVTAGSGEACTMYYHCKGGGSKGDHCVRTWMGVELVVGQKQGCCWSVLTGR